LQQGTLNQRIHMHCVFLKNFLIVYQCKRCLFSFRVNQCMLKIDEKVRNIETTKSVGFKESSLKDFLLSEVVQLR